MAMASVGELIMHCEGPLAMRHGRNHGSHMPIASFCPTPHAFESHEVSEKAQFMFTSSTHQPRSWSKAEANLNIPSMVVTLWTAQLPMYWLNDEAFSNMFRISVTASVLQPPIS